MNPMIPLFVAAPLAGAFLIMILGKFFKNLNKYIASLTLLFLIVFSILLLIETGKDILVYKIGGWEPVGGIPIGIYLVADGFNTIVLCIINFIGLLSVIYSISYISKYTSENYFYSLFCLMIAGMNGVVLSGDLFNIFVFLEISAIASYALVAYGVGIAELEATFKYQVLGGIASLLILLGISFIYWQAKTLNIADIRLSLRPEDNRSLYILVQLLLLTGFGLKAAITPFHSWLPDAHSSAPTPISAMLSGVLIKAAGIYVIMRLFFNMFIISEEIAILITCLGAISIITGSFLMIGQWDVKRLLAYSSISQIGYILMAAGICMILLFKGGKTEIAVLALAGGLFHMINHAAFKSLLFLTAGSIEYRTGTRDLREMGGLASAMPLTYSTSFIGSLSISGIPPFNGFFSKLIIIIAAIMGHFYLLALIAVIASIITLAAFLKYQRYAFHNKKSDAKVEKHDAPFPMAFSLIVLSIMCLLLSIIAIPHVRELLLTPAINVLMNPNLYTIPILGM